MLNTERSLRGMVTSPHHLASGAGLEILREGGTAIEAAVAMAASLAVVYPHMNSIGGDGFWLIAEPGRDPVAIDACGRAAAAASVALYRGLGLTAVPWRGPLAANTVAGALSGWQAALEISAEWGGRLPLSRLLDEPIRQANGGIVVTDGVADTIAAKWDELADPASASIRLLFGKEPPAAGTVVRQRRMAETLRRLANAGLADFYRGDISREIAADLAELGSPVSREDLLQHRALMVRPLSVEIAGARLFNLPPPTQGLASLMILALFDRLQVKEADGFDHLHGLVEVTKRAFQVRDRHVGDPEYMRLDAQGLLDNRAGLDRMAADIDPRRALPWPEPSAQGDTVWFGAVDGEGRAASVIQSTYFEFGSGLVLPRTGIIWQNRGASFRIADDGWNALKPGRKPFHTLNPAMARLNDGRLMIYGTMGGEGQPQTQAAVFTRYTRFGQGLQAAVTAPRWLLGRTWGDDSTTLKLESRFDERVVAALREAGHAVELVAPFTSLMGHAGAIVRHPDGSLEGAADPRSDGAVAAW